MDAMPVTGTSLTNQAGTSGKGDFIPVPWSSAVSHCTADKRDDLLTVEPWDRRWTFTTWREYLADGELEANLAIIRQRTHTGRPLGTAQFVQELEKTTNRALALQKRGPREKIVTDRRQGELRFDS
jgi:hypothetical protein